MEDVYEKARKYLAKFETLSEADIYSPPSHISLTEGEFLDFFQIGENSSIPSMTDFSKVCQNLYRAEEERDIIELSLRALDDNAYIFVWAKDILGVLWSIKCKQLQELQ